ncbi:RNA-directed DNA polymerase, eukaryota, reverse transcriptase zinc-binding domain protein [Tanacetum coccineum]
MVHWIMSCVTTVTFSICVNGESCGYFRGRGLRQGDPTSPYLFTLVMEMLNLIVHDKVDNCKEFKYHFGCQQVKITHVCFADDLLMFCHGDKISVSVLKNAIEEFGEISGLLPNYNKSTILFGSMKMVDQEEILDCVPFKIEKLPVKYLGVPLTSTRLSVNNCRVLIDKIKSKVFDWKNKSLSYAGRLQLIASVLESVHVYRASVFLLPKTVIKDINRILKNFLWNQGELSKGKAKVAWKNVCKPKTVGGLGIKELEVWNKCMIIKHLWNIVNNKNSLWVKWVNTVKLKGRSIWAINEDVNDSWGWKNILKMREVKKFIVIRIGNGEKTFVLYDNWCGAGILQSFITNRDVYNARRNTNMVVKDIVEDGKCKWPEEWVVKYPILLLHENIKLDPGKEDKIVWRSKDGKERKFNVSQVYFDLSSDNEAVKWSNLVWFTQNIPKHSFILWLAIQNKLSTQDKIKSWGSFDMMMCSLCNQDMDSHQHLFFQCKYAEDFWSKICTVEILSIVLSED